VNSLTVSLTEDEKLVIGNELTRLFSLQDMPLSKEKKGYFLEELFVSGLPAGAILEGLRSLVTEELRSIKITTVTEAARDHLTAEDQQSVKACASCFDGWIVMKDEKKREFILACTCARGHQRKGDLATWNGEETFYRNGRWLTIFLPLPTSENNREIA
jgi:hypothetical protein